MGLTGQVRCAGPSDRHRAGNERADSGSDVYRAWIGDGVLMPRSAGTLASVAGAPMNSPNVEGTSCPATPVVAAVVGDVKRGPEAERSGAVPSTVPESAGGGGHRR